MADLKTQPTRASVRAFLDGIEDEQRRRDCKALVALMKRVTGEKPTLWGSNIVGFGSYHYRYPSGHEGDSCLVGFASRKDAITLYLAPGWDGREALLKRLGKHKTGKGCLYIKRLEDVSLAALEELITESVAELERRHPGSDR